MTDLKPTAAGRALAAKFIISRHTSELVASGGDDNHFYVKEITRHAAEREAQVIAEVVAAIRGGPVNPNGTKCFTPRQIAFWLERGGWKGPRHAE